MSRSATAIRLTPDDLERMPDGDRFELVDGELVERNLGSESAWVAGSIIRLLGNFVVEQNLGLVWPSDQGYRCFADDPDRLRRPDVSFIGTGRLPNDRPSKGYETAVPDLVVEVVSPNDLVDDLDRKVEEYLAAGVPLIWVVNPDTRTVAVYRQDGSTDRLRNGDELTGDDVVAGFYCSVAEFFPKPISDETA